MAKGKAKANGEMNGINVAELKEMSQLSNEALIAHQAHVRRQAASLQQVRPRPTDESLSSPRPGSACRGQGGPSGFKQLGPREGRLVCNAATALSGVPAATLAASEPVRCLG